MSAVPPEFPDREAASAAALAARQDEWGRKSSLLSKKGSMITMQARADMEAEYAKQEASNGGAPVRSIRWSFSSLPSPVKGLRRLASGFSSKANVLDSGREDAVMTETNTKAKAKAAPGAALKPKKGKAKRSSFVHSFAHAIICADLEAAQASSKRPAKCGVADSAPACTKDTASTNSAERFQSGLLALRTMAA
jgi:hypothetical protein